MPCLSQPNQQVETRVALSPGLVTPAAGYRPPMLYTILIILAIVALVLFILGRRSV